MSAAARTAADTTALDPDRPADRHVVVRDADRRAFRAAWDYLAGGQTLFAAGFWVLFALVMVVVPLVVHANGGVMGSGVLTGAGYSARWFAFSLGIATTSTLITMHLAAGGTRRSFLRATVATAAVVGLAYGALYGLATVGEQALFGALGWDWVRPEGLPATGAAATVADAAAEGLACAVYALVGTAIGMGYQSHGSWLGTALILPGLALLALAGVTTRTGAAGDTLGRVLPFDGPTGVLVGLLGALVTCALAAAWLRVHLLRVQLRPPS
jgi:hypothetical protein